MVYEYKIMTNSAVMSDVRGIFGIDDLVLSDAVINSPTNMPAAELSVEAQLGVDISTIAETYSYKLYMAILYTTAANCLSAVKINLLKKEDDNKTSGERFASALSITEASLLNKAQAFISTVKIDAALGSAYSKDIFSSSSPTVDEITGDDNA